MGLQSLPLLEMHAPNGTIKSLLPNAEQVVLFQAPGGGRGFTRGYFQGVSRQWEPRSGARTPADPYRSPAPGPAVPLPPRRVGHMDGRTPALPPVRRRRDGPEPPGRPRRPLKSVPIYISRRPPAPAGGGAGEIRLPFPSRAER